MVTGDHRTNLFAGCPGPCGIFDAAHRPDEELVGSQYQLRAKRVLSARATSTDQGAAAFGFRQEGVLRRQRVNRVPGFGGCHQRGASQRLKIEAEISRTPECAVWRVPPVELRPISNRRPFTVKCKCRSVAVQRETQRWKLGAGRNFVSVLLYGEGILAVMPGVDRRVMRTKMNGGTDSQSHVIFGGEQPVCNVYGVLGTGHYQAFFQHQAILFVSPYRKAALETEFGNHQGGLGTARQFRRADVQDAAAREAQPFGQRIEHHDSPVRIGERGDQITMVAPRNGAADGSRRVTAEGISDQPLFLEMRS